MAAAVLICALALSQFACLYPTASLTDEQKVCKMECCEDFLQTVWISEGKPSSGSCDWRYYRHYETKGCSPVIGRDGCPVRFECKPLSQEEREVCHYKGRKYHPKEQIEDMGPCDHCQCSQENANEDAFISCAEVDCPDDVHPQNKSCYVGHCPDSCCPVEFCPPSDGGPQTQCDYRGVSYRLGDYISTDDLCKSCICTKGWTGIDGPGCLVVDCITDQYAREIRDGCLPVYHEKTCCPLDVNCGNVHGSTPVTSPEDKEKMCLHKGKYYDIGSVVYLEGDKFGCHPCTCSVPPDFTCVQKACPPPPKPECQYIYGQCCPQYKCP